VWLAAPIIVAAAMGSARASAPSLAVPLTVSETAGVRRRAFPTTAGVPLPPGVVRSIEQVWLADPAGRPTLVQAEPLERWPDGSVRWLLLDFLADVPAGGHATYTLRGGPSRAPPPGPSVIRVRLTGDGRAIDTGALSATLPAAGDAIATALVAGRATLERIPLPTLSLVGSAVAAAVPGHVGIETAGPVRTEFVLTGRYPQGLAYETRVAFFAGQRFVRVQHTLTNVADPLYAEVRALALTVPGPFSSGALGIDGERHAFRTLDPPRVLEHTDATPAELDGKGAGRHADGWAEARSRTASVLVAARWFWEEYPKSFRLAPDRLELDLLAGGGEPVRFGTGAAKTHEVWLALGPPGDEGAAALARALQAPLVVLPPASWIASTGALPGALDPEAPGARDFLARFQQAFAGYEDRVRTERWDDGAPVRCAERTVEHPRVGLYGDLNWGDWQFPGYRDDTRGCDGWGNLEYDLPETLALAWVSSGDPRYLAGLVPAARHYRDVDIIHHAPEGFPWVGLNHPHKALHFSFEAPEKVDLGHTWTAGLIDFYRLTGERRALEAARGIADGLVLMRAGARNPRQFGWPMVALVAVYQSTGEEGYLDAAQAYAADAMRAFRPTPAAGDWKMGILADGLAAVHAAGGDDRIRRWLVAYADDLVARPERWKDPRYALPLGYVARLTGDRRYADAARATVRGMNIGRWGKPLAALGRTGFRVLAPLPVTPGPAAPPPGSPPARSPR
jgi:PcRGLX-like N-terminal RIFT barrel domain/Beta-L-arabinofuranosidase, GH127 catalytic domain